MLGEQRPRLEVAPPSGAEGWGAEVADLAARCGVTLDPWQRHVLDVGLAEGPDGLFAALEVCLLVSRQNGKGLAEDTPLPCPGGWVRMGDVVPGQRLYDEQGKECTVTWVSERRLLDCYRVTFSDGTSVVADGDHLWQVFDIRAHGGVDETKPDRASGRYVKGRWLTLQTRDMRPEIGNRGKKESRYRLPDGPTLEAPDASLPIDPYVFGAWLGDGHSSGAMLTCGDQDLPEMIGQIEGAEYVVKTLRQKTEDGRRDGPWTFRIGITDRRWDPDGFGPRLRLLGVQGNKHIPDCYLRASPAQRLALMQGLMDTDGTVHVNGTARTSRQCEFSVTSESLAYGFIELARSLGIRATMKRADAKLYGRWVSYRWRISFTTTLPVFRLGRKAAILAGGCEPRKRARTIQSIEPVPAVPTRCLGVDSPSHLFLCGEGMVPTHNSAALAALAVAAPFIYDARLVIYSAHEFKTAKETFRLASQMVKDGPLRSLWAKNRESGVETGIEFKNGARIIFVARSRSSGRGFTGDLVILDEAFSLQQAQLGALLPTLSSRPNPQVWLASSAPMHDSEALHKIRGRALSDSPGRLAFMEWSVEPGTPLDDRAGWAQANPALGHRLTERWIETELHAMPPREFERERLGIGDDPDGSGVVDLARWTALIDGDSEIARPLAFAFDVTPERDGAAVAVAGVRLDGAAHVEITESLPGVEWLLGYLVERWRRWSVPIWVELSSPAAALIGPLEAHGVEVKTQPRGGGSAALLADAVVAGSVRHLGQASLTSALVGARRKVLGDTWSWSRASSTTDISPLVAASLAHYGAMVEPPPPPRRRARVL